MKRFFYLLSIVGVVALVIGVGYFLRYRSGETPSPEGDRSLPGENGGGLPVGGGGGTTPPTGAPGENGVGGTTASPPKAIDETSFGIIAENPVRSFFVDSDNKATLVQPDGKVARVVKGQTTVLSSSPIANLMHTAFSFNGRKLLVVFGSRSAPQLSVFDVETRTWEPLSLGAQAVSWSPQTYEIAYLADRGGTLALLTLDLGNPKAKPQELIRLTAQDLAIQWALPSLIFLQEKPSALVPASLWGFDTKKKTLSRLLQNQPGLSLLWGAEAEMGLLFSGGAGERGGELSLFNKEGLVAWRLSLLTLPEKCVFRSVNITTAPSASATSTKTPTPAKYPFLYCGVPRNFRDFSIQPLPDAYMKRALFAIDDIFRIDLKGGDVAAIFVDSPQDFDATALQIANGRLFFINRLDERLYALSLEE